MTGSDRRKWTVFAVLLAALGMGIVVVAVAGGGGGSGKSGSLTLERYNPPGAPAELLVSVNREANRPATARRQGTVGLECQDGRGRNVLQARVEWPFIEEPGFGLPHIHQQASDAELSRVAKCRLTGTTVALEGRLGLSR